MEQQKNLFEKNSERAKFCAAKAAILEISDNMKVGLGSGSTAEQMIKCLGQHVARQHLNIICTATSKRSHMIAQENGLQIVELHKIAPLDVVIDGTDEFDAAFRLIKGGGGAHLCEKIVAQNAKHMIVITDISKQVSILGQFPLPVEVTPFAHEITRVKIEQQLLALGYQNPKAIQRMQSEQQNTAFISDEGNYIYDLHLNKIECAKHLDSALLAIAGVVETGLFLDICSKIIIGFGDGTVKKLCNPALSKTL